MHVRMKITCDLIKVSTTVTIAPFWLWMRGSTEPPSHLELVETSHWRVAAPIRRRKFDPSARPTYSVDEALHFLGLQTTAVSSPDCVLIPLEGSMQYRWRQQRYLSHHGDHIK